MRGAWELRLADISDSGPFISYSPWYIPHLGIKLWEQLWVNLCTCLNCFFLFKFVWLMQVCCDSPVFFFFAFCFSYVFHFAHQLEMNTIRFLVVSRSFYFTFILKDWRIFSVAIDLYSCLCLYLYPYQYVCVWACVHICTLQVPRNFWIFKNIFFS